MGTMDFLHRLSKFLDQQRMECVFPDSMEVLSLENPSTINDQNLPELEQSLLDNSEMPHTKTKLMQQQLKQGMVSFLYHAAMGKRRYPWL